MTPHGRCVYCGRRTPERYPGAVLACAQHRALVTADPYYAEARLVAFNDEAPAPRPVAQTVAGRTRRSDHAL